MNYTYYLISSTQSYTGSVSFGIAAVDHDNHIVAVARDISTDREKVARLVALCNDLCISIIHFDEVIDDFIE